MSLRQAFRSKFRSEGKDKEASSVPEVRYSEDTEDGIVMVKHDENDNADSSKNEHKLSHLGHKRPSLGDASHTDSLTMSLKDVDEQQIYELQLTQLQEHLVAAMIENQTLNEELRLFRETNKVERILQDLDFQREKNRQLEEKNKNIEQTLRKRQTESHHSSQGSLNSASIDNSDGIDIAQEATEVLAGAGDDHGLPGPRKPKDKWVYIQEVLLHQFYELMADFTEDPTPEEIDQVEEDPLTVKKLKDNIKRFKTDVKPILDALKGIKRIVTWKTPSLTLIIFTVYMYSVWYGWLLPVLLFFFIFQLGINYLRHRGWNINVAVFSEVEDDDKENEAFRDLGMSDKFNLVVQVARQVQNTLGKIADNVEKIKSLLTWQQPEATLRLLLMASAGFVLASVLPGTTLFTVLGLMMGVKFFIIEFIYHRFPRIKYRHDTVDQIWRSLPTEADIEMRYHRVFIDKNIITAAEEEAPNTKSESQAMCEEDRQFCELFTLPSTEAPLPSWQGGRRCTLINREKNLTSAFKHGRLYLTRSFLCFERSHSVPTKNIMIPLTEIISIEKAKPYTWMPGAGMSIEITTQSHEKPIMFGAILNRDECFDAILASGLRGSLPWARDRSSTSPSPALERRKSGASTPAHKTSTTSLEDTQMIDSQNPING